MSCGCQATDTACSCAATGQARSRRAAVTVARLAYRDGQKLVVRDLQEEQARDAALRRQHIRYQHETWGIALGFGVQVDPDDESVVVSAGYAVDALGRDLVLSADRRLPVPGAAGPPWMALVAEAGEGIRTGDALFRWHPLSDVQPGAVVPLAAANVVQGKVVGALDLRLRRYARKLVRPRIGAGVTEAGGTDWTRSAASGSNGRFLTVEVDTSECGFLAHPRYVACLEPPPGATPGGVLRPLAWIASARADSFTFQVARRPPPLGLDLGAEEARKEGWSVSWIGVETWAGAEPLLLDTATTINDVASLLFLFGAAPIGGKCL